MNSSQYMLSHYINGLSNVEDVNKHIFNTFNIMTKDYPEEDMTIYYNKYDNKHKTPMELATRSVILSKSDKKVICYTCPTPIYNIDAIQYLWRHQNKPKSTYLCYEGSLMSVFYYKKWHIASRKNIYDEKSEENKNQYQMFMEVLKEDGYNSINDFTMKLDPKYTYHFVLIHHNNDNIVNYTNEFGNNYKKLCFIFARNAETLEEVNSEDIVNSFVSSNIFLPKKISEEEEKDMNAKLSDPTINSNPEYEGLIIKINNEVLKLQSSSYQFYKAIGTEKNMFRGFINLYQSNSLKKFFTHDNDKYKKIINPLNTKESFDTIGMIDALFKVLTSELYNLFIILWNENGEHLNKNLYTILPREYKDMLFHLRGVKQKNKNHEFKLNDVYHFIKSVDISLLEKFIRCRKLMLNWVKLQLNENVKKFSDSLHKCEKVYYKLSAIYTSKLFPEIMPDDLPIFGKTNEN